MVCGLVAWRECTVPDSNGRYQHVTFRLAQAGYTPAKLIYARPTPPGRSPWAGSTLLSHKDYASCSSECRTETNDRHRCDTIAQDPMRPSQCRASPYCTYVAFLLKTLALTLVTAWRSADDQKRHFFPFLLQFHAILLSSPLSMIRVGCTILARSSTRSARGTDQRPRVGFASGMNGMVWCFCSAACRLLFLQPCLRGT